MDVILDDRDIKLIQLLEQDARQSSTEIGKRLGMSSSGVRRRVNKLIKDGTLHISAYADPDKTGFPLEVLIAFDVENNKINQVMKLLCDKPEVHWVAATTGRFDILTLGRFKSTRELYHFIATEISTLEGIINTETFISLHTEKRFAIPVISVK